MKLYDASTGYDFSTTPYTLTWAISSVYTAARQCSITDNVTALGTKIALDSVTPSGSLIFDVDQFSSTVFTSFSNVVGTSPGNYSVRLGFLSPVDYFIYCCQQSCRVLENFGVPTDLIARSAISTYIDDFFNAMPQSMT